MSLLIIGFIAGSIIGSLATLFVCILAANEKLATTETMREDAETDRQANL